MTDREKLIELQLQAYIADNISENTTEHRGFVADFMIANGVTVQEWISVKDRLPDVGSVVLVSDNETDCHVWQHTNYSERGIETPWMDEFGIPCKTEEITHWMPLPQPPKGE